MLDYDFEDGNFAQVSNQVTNEDGVTVGTSGSTDYTDGNTYSLTGIINSNYTLRVTFNNLNTRAATTNNRSTTGRYRNPMARYSSGSTIGDTK